MTYARKPGCLLLFRSANAIVALGSSSTPVDALIASAFTPYHV